MRGLWMAAALACGALGGCDSGSGGSGGDAGPVGGSGGGGGGLVAATGYTDAQLQEIWVRISACGRTPLNDEYVDLVYILAAAEGARAVQLRAAFDCILAADDCETASACSPETPTDVVCDDDTFQQRCDGDVRIRCDDFARSQSVEVRADCHDDTSGNTHCQDSNGWSQCTSGVACEGTDERCDGDVAIRCDEGFEVRRDCALQGETCLYAPEEGYATCVAAATGCEPCAGKVAQRCDGEVIQSRLDCAALGLRCQAEPDGDGQCVAEPSACGAGNERCEGEVAEVCILGKWFPFDCAVAGATCATRDDHVFCDLP